MVTFEPYKPEHKSRLLDIFRSNMPLYFAQEELPLFDAFLDRDIDAERPYWVVIDDNEIVGCGGIGINQPTKYTPVLHVIMCWGMVHQDLHKRGYGGLLLQHRITQAGHLFPATRIALGTTQHSFPFFEKFGFKTVCYEKDHWAKDLDLYQMELL